MEDEEELTIPEKDNKLKRDEVVRVRRKWRKEDDIRLEKNVSALPRYLREHGTQKDSILKTRMSLNKTNDRGFCRWCFVADVWR